MKVYSWNVSDNNKKHKSILSFIKGLEFDVLCLQEVTQELLTELQLLPYNCTYHLDFQRNISGNIKQVYLVLLTPHTIKTSHTFFISQGLQQPLRTKLFIKFMKVFGWSDITVHGSLYADVHFKDYEMLVRVFCTHFRLTSPQERRKEFSTLTNYLSKDHITIICGDFNVVDISLLKPFNFLLGAELKESFPWYPERKILESLFRQYNLNNPLQGKPTHTLFAHQLDHILVPTDIQVRRTKVCKNAVGSDHYPIFVELE